MRRYLLPLLLPALALILAAACGRGGEPVPPERGGTDQATAPPQGGGQDAQSRAASEEALGMKGEPAPQPAAGYARDGAAGGDAGSLPADLLERKISYQTSVDLSVDDVTAGRHEAERIAQSVGGYVAGSRTYQDGERRVAQLTLRVPAVRYAEALEQLRGLAVEVQDEQTATQDFTEEYTDLQARLRNLQAVEQQYLELLGRASQIGEVLQVQDRLNTTRLEIERVQGRIQLLDRMTELATIDVRLAPAAPQAEGDGASVWEPVRAAERAWDASVRLLAAAAEAGIMAVVFSWWLVPFLVLAWWLTRRWRLRAQAPPESGAAGT